MVDWITNEAPRWLVLSVWIIINVVLFVITYLRYYNADDYYYLRELTGGKSLASARASAMCLKFNTMLILLPVCRKLISFVRGSCSCCPQPLRRQLDKTITYHQYLAYMICIHSAIHIGAHCFNFENLSEAQRIRGDDIKNYLSRLPLSPNGTWINPIRTTNPDPLRELFKTVAGVSGVVITLCLVIIVTSSTEIIRRSYFELFWFTHHIFIVYLVGFLIHGVGMIVRRQSNLDNHPLSSCKDKPTDWGTGQCAVPQFEGTPSDSWMWLLVPMVIYLIERIARLVSGMQRVVIIKVVTHPSRVFELRMQKKGFSAAPGQYILIQCPSISRLEWHPFTLTSAPNDDFFSVHIRRVGDWTEELAKLCHVDEGDFQEAWKMPSLYVDGPFGTATEDVLAYDVSVLVGCGIGVTPFASVLKSFWYRFCHDQRVSLQHLHLFWVCPDTSSFEWFQSLLLDLERQMRQRDTTGLLTVSIYLTRGWNANQARNIVLHDDSSVYDAVTGLHHKTQYGRPNWEPIFKELAENHKGLKTGVFFCGPKQLSTTLHKLCNRFSKLEDKTRFVYNKEHF
ncbi:pre-mRNA-splicing factor syf2 [Plakobranchus ocellatus]|uniref:Pre-mRNA-splicing factor syf2 n=1 Tax=Plakobranchus ocellatus TaxID=259542 RepID=A0AAV4AZR7_9GAST|nr:pre-mRNA-splicing factor syf2 [Plakobranchus ocellatus]